MQNLRKTLLLVLMCSLVAPSMYSQVGNLSSPGGLLDALNNFHQTSKDQVYSSSAIVPDNRGDAAQPAGLGVAGYAKIVLGAMAISSVSALVGQGLYYQFVGNKINDQDFLHHLAEGDLCGGVNADMRAFFGSPSGVALKWSCYGVPTGLLAVLASKAGSDSESSIMKALACVGGVSLATLVLGLGQSRDIGFPKVMTGYEVFDGVCRDLWWKATGFMVAGLMGERFVR